MFRSFPRKRESSSSLLAPGSPLSRGRAELMPVQFHRNMLSSFAMSIPKAASHFSGSCRTRRLQHLFEPVPHISRADALVVDLAVMIAALVAGEELECLLFGADRVEALLRLGERDL